MRKGASTPTGSTSWVSGVAGVASALAARVSVTVSVRTCSWRNWVARWRRAAQLQRMSVFSSVMVSAPAGADVSGLDVCGLDAFGPGVPGLFGLAVSCRRYTSLSICPPRRKLPLTPSSCKLLPAGMWCCTRCSRVLSDSSVADQNHSPPAASASTANSPSASHMHRRSTRRRRLARGAGGCAAGGVPAVRELGAGGSVSCGSCIGRCINACQKVNPRFMCRRTLRSLTP